MAITRTSGEGAARGARTIIAIDPGASGGIAIGNSDSGKAPALYAMPETLPELVELLRNYVSMADHPVRGVVELVSGFIGTAQPASRSFVFGQSYGSILGVLAALGVSVDLIRPQAWQKTLGIGTSGGDKAGWKRKLRDTAQMKFPDVKITLKTADAALIWSAAAQGHI